MNEKQTIAALREEVRINHIAEDLAVLFSESKRTETVVDLRKLRGKLVMQGTNMDDILWLKALKVLEANGIGMLEYDTDRRPLRLVDVGVTLKSLGDAIFGKRETLDRPRFGQGAGRKADVRAERTVTPMFSRTPAPQRTQAPAVPQRRETDGMQPSPAQAPLRSGHGRVHVAADGSVTFDLPNTLSMEDIAALVEKFHSRKSGKSV